jgi:hypothetical protein
VNKARLPMSSSYENNPHWELRFSINFRLS